MSLGRPTLAIWFGSGKHFWGASPSHHYVLACDAPCGVVLVCITQFPLGQNYIRRYTESTKWTQPLKWSSPQDQTKASPKNNSLCPPQPHTLNQAQWMWDAQHWLFHPTDLLTLRCITCWRRRNFCWVVIFLETRFCGFVLNANKVRVSFPDSSLDTKYLSTMWHVFFSPLSIPCSYSRSILHSGYSPCDHILIVVHYQLVNRDSTFGSHVF